MESKIMQIFYGNDCLPYKDKDRVVHYPIIGSAFQGASQTTEIRFYIDRIGGTNATWVAVSKLPNGKVGTKILESSYDYELDENYVTLQLSSFYTQAKGDLYISLQGYDGGVQVEYDSETEIYDVVGTPVIQATGSVKIAINYATQYVGSDENEQITVQEALALVSRKADTEYVKYGRLVHDITISNIPLVDPTGIDTDDYEPSQSEQLNEYFDNGIPMGIYDEEYNYGFVLVCSPRLFSETLDSPTNLVAMYRSARYDEQGKGKYLLVFLSPNKKFYAYLFSDSDVIYGDDYATKYLVDYLINKYGEQGNILRITSFPTTLNANQQYLISRKDCVIVDGSGIIYRRQQETESGSQFLSIFPTSGGGRVGATYFAINYTNQDHKVDKTITQNLSYSYQSANNLFGVTIDIDDEFKLYLKNNNGVTLATVDLPLESVVVSGEYDNVNKKIVLTLEDGSTVEIPVGDLVEGLVDEQGLEEALQPYVKEIEVSSVLTTNDLIEQVGTNKNFVLDNMGDPLLCYISEDIGTYTLSMVGKNKSNIATFTENTLVINLLGNATLDIDYLPIIELSSAMQTLTSPQLEIANQDNSVIKYGNRLYNKANVGDTSIEFVSVDYDIITDSESHRLTKYEITVNRTTGATNMITFYVNFYSVGELENKLEKYAKVDGNYPTMTVGNADALTPYGENSGANDTTPFVFQSTGGSSDVGVKAYLRALRGNSVAFNNICNHGNFDALTGWNYSGWTAVPTISNNIFTATSSGSASQLYRSVPKISGHKYIVKFDGKASQNASLLPLNWGATILDFNLTTSWQTFSVYLSTTPSGNENLNFAFANGLGSGTVVNLRNVQVFDLTQMFGAGNEPTSVLEFNRLFPKTYYPYNVGELLSCKVNGIKNVMYNAFDGQWTGTTQKISANFIKVIQGQTYTLEVLNLTTTCKILQQYDENKSLIKNSYLTNSNQVNSITLENNTCYVKLELRFASATDIPLNAVSFHLTWDSARTGFEPYKSVTYELPNIELRSAGSVYDELKPDGTLIRRVGVVDLGSLDGWANYGTGGTTERVTTSALSSLVKSTSANVVGNLKTTKFVSITFNNLYAGNNGIALNDTELYIKDASIIGKTTNADIKQALQGVYLFYELATPTETQDDDYKYQEVQDIDDFGTQEALYDNDIAIPVPQGNEFFYPVDYKAFIDSLGGREDIEYDATKVVSQTQLANYLKTISGYDATKTQTLKNVNGTLTWVDD